MRRDKVVDRSFPSLVKSRTPQVSSVVLVASRQTRSKVKVSSLGADELMHAIDSSYKLLENRCNLRRVDVGKAKDQFDNT